MDILSAKSDIKIDFDIVTIFSAFFYSLELNKVII